MYQATALKEEFIIKKIITIHYFEYCKDFVFSGEKHDFWEFVYVDKGEVDIYSDKKAYRLSQGEIIFHKPNEWHNVKATGVVAPNLVIVSFECKSRSMAFFKDRIMKISQKEKTFLGTILKEAETAFASPFGDPFTLKLIRKKGVIGAEQLIKISLEQILISLVRNNNRTKKNNSLLKERFSEDLVSSVVSYLNQNLGNKLSFPEIVHFAKVGSTSLKTAFKLKMNMGVMEYFAYLKIERAKQFIREANYNFSQISELLAYDSPARFTTQFKNKTGMTPTEYANSVKVNR